MSSLTAMPQQQRPATMLTTIGDDDTEGESVLIGDEETPTAAILNTEPTQTSKQFTFTHNLTSTLQTTKKKAQQQRSPPHKSPITQTKIQQHLKHKAAKKSPLGREPLNRNQKREVNSALNTYSVVNGANNTNGNDELNVLSDNQNLNMTMKNSNENLSKSPFTYTSKSKSKYN